MDPNLVLVTGPAAEPVTTAQAKDHLRIEHADEDARIARLITAARMAGERWTGRAFITQTYRLDLPGFPSGSDAIALAPPPVASITQISYIDGDGTSRIVSTSVYELVADNYRPRITLKPDQVWPSDVRSGKDLPVSVTFVAGYGAAEDVPEPYRIGVEQLVAMRYEHREPVVIGTIATEVPMTVQALFEHDRVVPV